MISISRTEDCIITIRMQSSRNEPNSKMYMFYIDSYRVIVLNFFGAEKLLDLIKKLFMKFDDEKKF